MQIVKAFQMHNFLYAGYCKDLVSSINARGVVFGHGTDGQIVISNSAKKTPSLISCRVEVFIATKHFSNMGHALSLSNIEFQYMDYCDVLGILAEGWQ